MKNQEIFRELNLEELSHDEQLKAEGGFALVAFAIAFGVGLLFGLL